MAIELITNQTGVTAAGNSQSSPLVLYRVTNVVFHLIVTSAGGTTPSLTVTIQDSIDGVNWADVKAFTAMTATGITRLGWSDVGYGIAKNIAVRWTVSGTSPSFNFQVLCDPQHF